LGLCLVEGSEEADFGRIGKYILLMLRIGIGRKSRVFLEKNQ